MDAAPSAEVAQVEEAAPPAQVAERTPPAEVAEAAPPPAVADVVPAVEPVPVPEIAVIAEPAPVAESVPVESAPASVPAEVPTSVRAEVAPTSVPAESASTSSRPAGRTARVLAALKSHRGREQPQNDDAGVMIPERGLFMVAAGVGAEPRGGVATKMAMEIVQKTVEAEPVPTTLRGKALPALVAAVQRANADIYAAARGNADLKGMGATFAAVLAMGRAAGLVQVGDSRIYRLRRGDIEQLTPQAGATSRRPRGLGLVKTLEVESSAVTGQPGDALLLCTPGVHRAVDIDDLAAILNETESPDAAAERIVAKALTAGGPADATALVIRWER